MERSFREEVAKLRLGDGETFHGEGILAVTKALLQSGVSYVGGYQGAPVSHMMDVLNDARDILDELGVHTLHAKSPDRLLQPFGQLLSTGPVPSVLQVRSVPPVGQLSGSLGAHTLHAKVPDRLLQPFAQAVSTVPVPSALHVRSVPPVGQLITSSGTHTLQDALPDRSLQPFGQVWSAMTWPLLSQLRKVTSSIMQNTASCAQALH
jgi:hypothetical protein